MKPIILDKYEYRVIGLSPLRERRLLQMAWHLTGSHKQHYPEYCYLMGEGLVQWSLGTAFLTEAGIARMNQLLEQGV